MFIHRLPILHRLFCKTLFKIAKVTINCYVWRVIWIKYVVPKDVILSIWMTTEPIRQRSKIVLKFWKCHDWVMLTHEPWLYSWILKKDRKKCIDQETQKHIDRVMEVKRIISAKYADNAIDFGNISSDFSRLLGVDNSLRNLSPKNDSLMGLIFASKHSLIGQYSLHIQSEEIAFLSFKSSAHYKLATNELIRLEL